jgi:hypothetical protein
MADKIYQTEGAMEMAASIKPMSDGYFLMKADDIQVAEGKSLAEYIDEGGGGSGGSGDAPAVDYTTVWEIKETFDGTGLPTLSKYMIKIAFTSNGKSYKGIHTNTTGTDLYYYSYVSMAVHDYLGWAREEYRTITIQEKITDARLYAWLKKNAVLLSGTVEPPIQYAYDELLNTENKTVVGAINEINSNGGGGTGVGGVTSTSAMPAIRYVGLRGNNYLSNLDGEEQSVEFTVEVTNELLQVGDTLQLCGMRTFNASPKNKVSKRKLRRFVEHEITEEDLNNRVLTLTVHPTKNAFAFLGHNNRQGGGTCTYYFRIRRPVGDTQNNDSGMTVDAKFSNVVPVTMLNIVTSKQEDEEGNVFKELKINVI